MQKHLIHVGTAYTDGKGNVRLVVAQGPQYTLYSSQSEKDNLRYKVIAKKRGPHAVGEERNSTRASFANWAKAVVP